jgi:hypothetical protein
MNETHTYYSHNGSVVYQASKNVTEDSKSSFRPLSKVVLKIYKTYTK